MSEEHLSLGEPADETAWRALVDKALKGAPWARLVSRTADGIEIKPLYRESDFATATDVSGFPGATPFVRGAVSGAWLIRQAFDHPDPAHANRDILADLQGGVGAIELVIDPTGAQGVAIKTANDLDAVLADVILEAAPVSLDAGAHAMTGAELLVSKLRGVAPTGAAFNLDPIGALMRTGAFSADDMPAAADFAARTRINLPNATALRVDARPVHEAGGSEAQEIAAALATGIAYMRLLTEKGLAPDDASSTLKLAISVGQDVLVEAAKLRALRLCWTRVMEAFGVSAEKRAARIHAFTSRRMMTRYDAWTNILRVTTAAFAAAVGGADEITTLPLTDALGVATPFARRVARNTQAVLMEEAHLAHVRDPAGGAWFVENMTRELAAAAWAKMQAIEAQGGIIAVLQSGALQREIAEIRTARTKRFATRRETITGVTDFPLLDEKAPETDRRRPRRRVNSAGEDAGGLMNPIRWAEPFEALRDRAEAMQPRPAVFFANLGAVADFSPRANFARNLFAVGGIAAIGPEDAHETMEALVTAFVRSGAKVAVLTGSDSCYGEHAINGARALRDAGCSHIILAGEPLGTDLIQHFIWNGCDALEALKSLHAALGIN
ncbi:MAG: methylmalonyl-CoA mutase family protein [Pseudomonadota bacterium]